MPQLAPYDDQRDALTGHLDGVRMPKLMWCEAAAHACPRGGVAQLRPPGAR